MDVNRKELAQLLSVSYQTIPNYEAEGLPVIHSGITSGKAQEYDLKACIKWMLERSKKGKKGSEAAALRKLEAEADIAEIKRDKEMEKLIPITDVIKLIGSDYATVRSKLMLLPDRISHELYILNDSKDIKSFLDKEIRITLQGLVEDNDDWNTKLQKEVSKS